MSNRSHVQTSDRPLADTSAAALAETFKVLGDVTRVRILDALSRDEVPVCDLAELLGITQSAVSHQLRLLRHARLVKSRRDGQHIYYTLDDHHILKLFEQGLEHVQERTEQLVAANDRAERTSDARQSAETRTKPPHATSEPHAQGQE